MEAPAAAQEVPQDKHMEEFFQEVTAIKVKLWPALIPIQVSVCPAFKIELLRGCLRKSHLVWLVQCMLSGQVLLLQAHGGGQWHVCSPRPPSCKAF